MGTVLQEGRERDHKRYIERETCMRALLYEDKLSSAASQVDNQIHTERTTDGSTWQRQDGSQTSALARTEEKVVRAPQLKSHRGVSFDTFDNKEGLTSC